MMEAENTEVPTTGEPVRRLVVAKIDAFQARSGLTDRQMGIDLFNNHKILGKIRDPEQSVTLRTIERVERYIKSYPVGSA